MINRVGIVSIDIQLKARDLQAQSDAASDKLEKLADKAHLAVGAAFLLSAAFDKAAAAFKKWGSQFGDAAGGIDHGKLAIDAATSALIGMSVAGVVTNLSLKALYGQSAATADRNKQLAVGASAVGAALASVSLKGREASNVIFSYQKAIDGAVLSSKRVGAGFLLSPVPPPIPQRLLSSGVSGARAGAGAGAGPSAFGGASEAEFAAAVARAEGQVNAIMGAVSGALIAYAAYAVGKLLIEDAKLTAARAKVIEAQAMYAAKTGVSFENVDVLSRISKATGVDSLGLFGAVVKQGKDKPADQAAGLKELGLDSTVRNLAQIARGFESIADPVTRADAAVKIFGDHAEEALGSLNSKFADGAEREQEFGAGLDKISRTQIAEFGRDITSLKNNLTGLYETLTFSGVAFKTWEMSAATSIVQLTAALWAGVKEADKAVDKFFLDVMQISRMSPSEYKKEVPLPTAPAAAGGTAQDIITTQDTLARLEGARLRQEQTIEGQRKIALDAELKSTQILARLKTDEVTDSQQRRNLAVDAEHLAMRGRVAEANAREMEATKDITQSLTDRTIELRTEMGRLATESAAAGKSLSARRELEANQAIEEYRVSAARKKLASEAKPGEAVPAPTKEQIATALTPDQVAVARQGKLAELEAADAAKMHIKAVEGTVAITELLTSRFFELTQEQIKNSVAITMIGKTSKENRDMLAAEALREVQIRVARERISAGTPGGIAKREPTEAEISTALPPAEMAKQRGQILGNLEIAELRQWRTEINQTTESVTVHINAQKELASAIGKTVEEMDLAKVNAELMVEYGKSYGDPDKQAEISSVRTLKLTAAQGERSNEISTTNTELKVQIGLETALAAVQSQGEGAIRRVTEAYKLMALSRAGKGNEIPREIQLFNSIQDTEDTKRAAKIDLEIANQNALTQAELKGAEAVREQTEANQINLLSFSSSASGKALDDLISKTRELDRARHETEVSKGAMATSRSYSDRLVSLQQELVIVHELQTNDAARSQAGVTLRDLKLDQLRIEKDIIDTLAKQSLATGGLMNGLRAFIAEAGVEAEKPGKILHDGLQHATDGVVDSLTRAMTGQKGGWGRMFEEVGRGMVRSSVKSMLDEGVGALGKKFPGLHLPTTGGPQPVTGHMTVTVDNFPGGVTGLSTPATPTAQPGTLGPKISGPAAPGYRYGNPFGGLDDLIPKLRTHPEVTNVGGMPMGGVGMPPITGVDSRMLSGDITNKILDSVPHYAQGGTVTGPTLGLLGEAGPEKVTPLSSISPTGAGGGMGLDFTIDPLAGKARSALNTLQGMDLNSSLPVMGAPIGGGLPGLPTNKWEAAMMAAQLVSPGLKEIPKTLAAIRGVQEALTFTGETTAGGNITGVSPSLLSDTLRTKYSSSSAAPPSASPGSLPSFAQLTSSLASNIGTIPLALSSRDAAVADAYLTSYMDELSPGLMGVAFRPFSQTAITTALEALGEDSKFTKLISKSVAAGKTPVFIRSQLLDPKFVSEMKKMYEEDQNNADEMKEKYKEYQNDADDLEMVNEIRMGAGLDPLTEMPERLKLPMPNIDFDVVLRHELDHALQHSLGQVSKKSATEFLGKGKAGYYLQETGYMEVAPDILANEVGVRLMQPGLHTEMGLSAQEARSVAADYIRLLRKEYGTAQSKEIANRVFEAQRANRQSQYGSLSGSSGQGGGGGAATGIGSNVSGNVWNKQPPEIPKFQSGGDITGTGIGILHAGEKVIPAATGSLGSPLGKFTTGVADGSQSHPFYVIVTGINTIQNPTGTLPVTALGPAGASVGGPGGVGTHQSPGLSPAGTFGVNAGVGVARATTNRQPNESIFSTILRGAAPALTGILTGQLMKILTPTPPAPTPPAPTPGNYGSVPSGGKLPSGLTNRTGEDVWSESLPVTSTNLPGVNLPLPDMGGTERGPTGNQGDPVHVIQDGNQGSSSGPLSSLMGPAIPGLSKYLGGAGAGIGGGDLGGLAGGGAGSAGESVSSSISFGDIADAAALAGGGNVSPGQAYWVGERGPEPFVPHTSGRIIPNEALGGGGGGVHIGSIDARGADFGVTNRIDRALDMAHVASVNSAARNAHDMGRRRPKI